jgi:hypothetical protein
MRAPAELFKVVTPHPHPPPQGGREEETRAGDLSVAELVKHLEMLLRSTPIDELGGLAKLLADHWRFHRGDGPALLALLRGVFNDVALTPYTDFVDKSLRFVGLLESIGFLTNENHVDFLGHLLRQLGRHLTAYDLVTFHHQGANYPDALLLDQVLKAFLARAACEPGMFESHALDAPTVARRKRLRRRALRQGWLLRRRYEGHLVPDAPTSPGENARILPPPFERVPDEQITNPLRRTKRLYADDPMAKHLTATTRQVLQLSFDDLAEAEEFRELGMAVFLDRPLGVMKAPGEPDQTPLLTYEAFSRLIARGRLRQLRNDPEFSSTSNFLELDGLLADLVTPGLAIKSAMAIAPRPSVSLLDALRVADDFVICRTTSRSAAEFLTDLDLGPLGPEMPREFLRPWRGGVIVSAAAVEDGPAELLLVFDRSYRRRLELQVDASAGYECRGGIEYPRAGMRVLRVAEDEGRQDWNPAPRTESNVRLRWTRGVHVPRPGSQP